MQEPKLFAKSPTTVAAIQFTGGFENASDIITWVMGSFFGEDRRASWIPTNFSLSGLDKEIEMKQESISIAGLGFVWVGDWVVFGNKAGRECFEIFDQMKFNAAFLPINEVETREVHTERTLGQVFNALTDGEYLALTQEDATKVVLALQNRGILFRERVDG